MTEPAARVGRVPWVRLIAFLIAGICLYLALRGADWAEFGRVISGAAIGWLFVAALAFTLTYSIRATRWRILLQGHGAIGWPSVFWATMFGYLCNAYLPARAGDFLRSLLLSRGAGKPAGFVIGTTVTERLFDAVFVAVLAGLIVGTGSVFPNWAGEAAITLAGLGLLLLIVMFAAAQSESLVGALVGPLLARPGWPSRIGGAVNAFLSGAVGLQAPGPLAYFLLLGVAAWMVDVLAILAVSAGLGLAISPVQAGLLVVALALSASLPSTPGFIGVFQFVAVTVLTPFGFSQSEALALIVVYQIVMYATVTPWGALAIWRSGGFARIRGDQLSTASLD